MVLVATMLLCTIFILTAHHSDGTEQTYEMTDHNVTENISQDKEKAQSDHQDTSLPSGSITRVLSNCCLNFSLNESKYAFLSLDCSLASA